MLGRLALLLALLALALPAAARAEPRDAGGLLVYVFVVDGLDGDRVDAGRAPQLASLLRGGSDWRATYWRESRAQMIAETNPNHTAMATGAYPGQSGIIGNAFATYATGGSDGDSCPDGPANEAAAPVGVSGESPTCLLAQTFFGAIQASDRAQELTTAGIFGKPKLARIFSGRAGDRFEADHLWAPCLAPDADTPYCKQVPNRVFDEYALFDATVMDEVLRTVREGVPGDGRTFDAPDPAAARRPDLTFVNLPGVDSAGHFFGTQTGVYDAAILDADAQLERFVAQQRELGLWERTVMLVVSDHSMDSTPERSSVSSRFTGAGISGDRFTVVQNGSAALVYLHDRTTADRFALLAQMREAALGPSAELLAGPPAAEALYREPNPADGADAHTLAAVHPDWRLLGPRTPDLVVTTTPGVAFNEPLNPLLGNHGGPQTRDNFMALIGGAPAVRQNLVEGVADPRFDDTAANPGQSENVDVAPTVLRLLGMAPPSQSAGRVLEEALDTELLPALPAAGCGSTVRRSRRAVRRVLRCGPIAVLRAARRGRAVVVRYRLRRPGRVAVRLHGRGRVVRPDRALTGRARFARTPRGRARVTLTHRRGKKVSRARVTLRR